MTRIKFESLTLKRFCTMKKHQLKNYLKIGILLFGISVLAIACEKDSFYDNTTEQNFDSGKPTIRTITLTQASQKLTELSNKLNVSQHFDIVNNNQSNIYQRSSESSDFIVNTKVVKEITFGDYKSYTMFLESLPTADSSFYNVTIEDKNGTESMFITKYVPTQQWLNDKTQTFSGQVSSKKATELENPFDGNSGGIGDFDPFIDNCNGTVQQYTIWVPYACGCGHMPWNACSGSSCGGSYLPGFQPETVYECIPDNSPPDNNSNPNDSGTGSNSGTPNDDTNTDDGQDSITTLITDDEIFEQIQDSPCQSLAKLTQTDSLSANIRPIVDSLRTKTSLTKEWYTNFRNSEDSDYDGNTTTYNYQENGIASSTSIKNAPAKIGPSYFGQIHTHPNSRYNMFSWLDLRAIKDVYEGTYSAYRSDVFIMIVCSNDSVYSLKIDDINALNTALDADLANAKGNADEEKEKNIKEFLADEYSKSSNLEQTFLKFFGNHGISLYKATDTNLSNWKELELDTNDDEIVNETPC